MRLPNMRQADAIQSDAWQAMGTDRRGISRGGEPRGCWLLMLALLTPVVAVAEPAPTWSEAELLAVLRSETAEADKALACKFLAVNGSATAVGDLAPLLANPRLASWARIALEAIPGEEASATLRDAAGSMQGRLRVGAITSLGVRRDQAAVPLLAGLLAAEDAEVAAASAWSLGQIATVEAGELLAAAIAAGSSPDRLDAMARAAVLCAGNLAAAGQAEGAIALFGVVRAAEVSDQRRAEAIRGTILAKGQAGIPLLVETLRAPQKRLANMAIFTARDVGRGDPAVAAAVDAALVKELEAAAAARADERAVILIDVLAGRNAGGAGSTLATVFAGLAADGTQSAVRLAAIKALGRVGDAATTGILLSVLIDDDQRLAAAAQDALAALPGEAVDREIVGRLADADTRSLAAIVELIGGRRIPAVAEVLPLATHADARVRTAAISALGPTVDLANLGVLVSAAIAPASEAEGEAARAAVREASVRMPDREACAAILARPLATASAPAKLMLLDVLGEVGGRQALATLAAAAASGEQPLEDAATRILGKWMTADAAPVLYEIAAATPGGKFKTRALRGYLRIARQFTLPDAERAAMCRKALAVTRDEADRKAVAEILERYPAVAALMAAEAEAVEAKGAEPNQGTVRERAAESARPAVAFEKQVLSERFLAEGCAVADFDGDGHADIAAGNEIWHGPGFTRRTEYTPPRENAEGPAKTPYDPARGYSNFFLLFAHDFDGDSRQDLLVYDLPGEPAAVFVNPGKAGGHWPRHVLLEVADGESPGLVDITGDGRPEVFAQSSGPELGGRLGFAQVDWSQPLAGARFRPITPRSPENDKKYFRYTHGAGAGDVNGDGRVDILTKDGWFEQPADIASDTIWPFHPVPFAAAGARGGAQMLVFDVDGDGRNDVVTSYDAHGYGLGWFQQQADGSFSERRILGGPDDENPDGICFSQLHALAAADLDGDGLTDVVTGKRRWAHGPGGDPEPNAPPVLYWFRLVRDGAGNATFEPHLIDDDSGVGTQVTVADLDGDGRPDIAVANKRGVFAFRQRQR
jgi:HEAT repeat protein